LEEEKSLKSLLSSMLDSYRMTDKYDEVKIVNSWEEIVGKAIAQKTNKLFIKNHVLNLYLSSSPLKQELRYHKLVLIEKVNNFAGKEIIKDIQIF
jgi:hypothetical protein